MNALGQGSSVRICDTATAVRHFLKAMDKAVEATFLAWYEVLKDGIDDCHLPYETRRAVFDAPPLADYYRGGVIGLEAAQIRQLFTAQEATELLAQLAEQADATSGRHDRLVSAIAFDVISQIERITPNQQKLPHDQVVRVLMERLGLRDHPQTRPLFGNTLFRHHLGEPLARGVPAWWQAFRAKFVLTQIPAAAPVGAPIAAPAAAAPSPPPRRRGARSLI